MANPMVRLHAEGVSPWLDNLRRDMFSSGLLERMIQEDGIRGQTSNPTIFQKAISQGSLYDQQILELARSGKQAEEIVWDLMIQDVRSACDIFLPLHESSEGHDGYVSLELNPTMAHDTAGSLAQAAQLVPRVDRPNLMLKVPATPEGLPVVTELISQGIHVNVTLLFSVQRYEQVLDAWMTGLEKRLEKGASVRGLHSVASFFVSRVDSEAEKRMDAQVKANPVLAAPCGALRGRIAVANARAAYELFLQKVATPRWQRLQAQGASVQRPLWASTSTKNPAYRDTIYVDDLIGPDCVNTMPDDTIEAFRDHGTVCQTLTPENLADARKVLEDFACLGFNLEDMTNSTLVREGVEKFAASYQDLVETVRIQRDKLLAGS